MLEQRRYTYNELSALLGTVNVQGLHRKLNSYGVEHTIEGQGKRAVFLIEAISDPFKVFCITELHFPAQTDFDKLQDFYYWLFNDDEFMAMPDEVKETRMRQCGYGLSRQTISNYIQKLNAVEWINRDTGKYIYYFAHKGTQTITSQEKYRKAWHEYWREISESSSSGFAIAGMIANYGGIARKQAKVEVNGIYNEKVNYLCDLIVARIEKRSAEIKLDT